MSVGPTAQLNGNITITSLCVSCSGASWLQVRGQDYNYGGYFDPTGTPPQPCPPGGGGGSCGAATAGALGAGAAVGGLGAAAAGNPGGGVDGAFLPTFF